MLNSFDEIEQIKKRNLHVITGSHYTTYFVSLLFAALHHYRNIFTTYFSNNEHF